MNYISRRPPAIHHYKINPEQNTFRSLVVDLTHRCNMTCANCYIPNRDHADMDVDKLYDVLARLPKRTYIRLIGAEPTMRGDLSDIIRNVIKLGHKPSLNTNGLKLAHFDYCQELKDAGLTMVCISMNGADDDDVYKILDNGKYANLKTRALTNCLKLGFHINTGTIIARDVNEHIVGRQVDLVTTCAQSANVDFRTHVPWRRVPLVVRFKTVGAIGRHMTAEREYSKQELGEIIGKELNLDPAVVLGRPIAGGTNTVIDTTIRSSSAIFPHETKAGTILIRLVDWSVDGAGVVDPDSVERGRVTADWKIAPFYEDVKLNEFGY